MALNRPQLDEEHLPMGVARELDVNQPDGVNQVIERPADDGLPEVIPEDPPNYISSDEEEEEEEEEEGEYEVGIIGEDIFPLYPDFEDEFEDDDDDQLTESDWDDDEEEWPLDIFNEDSGYESMSEDEEEFEDDDNYDDDGIRPPFLFFQRFPPEGFWQGWRQVNPPVPAHLPVAAPAAGPQQLTVRHPLELPGQQVEPHEEPSVSQRREECAPSTSGLSSTKRSREETDAEEVSTKRQRWNYEERPEESAPSTSGLSSTKKSGEETDAEEVSTKRSREETDVEEVSTKRQRCNYEECPEESAPSTSGLGSSTNESSEESYRDSAPSTSDLRFSTNSGFWRGPFNYKTWDDDSDSD